MNTPLRVAVVGVGYLGRIHAKIYHQMAAVELVAVVDRDPETAAQVAQMYPCEALTTHAQLPARVDAVSIAVPTSMHLPVARPFLQAGVHTLLEKPIAATTAESAALVAAAKASASILQIGHLERFNAGVMKLAELAITPRFIEVHRLGEFVARATDVDVVTDLMIHDIDIVLALAQAPLTTICATGLPVITQHVDIANARLEFADGMVANVTASRVSRGQFRRIRVFSAERYLGLNFQNQQLEEVRRSAKKADHGFPELAHRQIKVTPQPPLDAELAHFIACIRTNTQPLVDGEAGLIAVQTAERVREKIAQAFPS